MNGNIEYDVLGTLEMASKTSPSAHGLRSKHEIFNRLPDRYTYPELLDALEQLERDGYIFSEVMQIRKWAITNEGREYLNM